MPQPRDFAEGYDPYKTDPLFRQLITEDELVNPPNPSRHRIQDSNQDRDDHRNRISAHNRPKRPFRHCAPKVPESHERSFVKYVFDFLLLSKDPWRLGMGLAVIFLMLNAGSSRGWISIPGFPVLAEAASVTEIRVEQLEEQIENAVKGHCLAPNSEGKSYYYRKIRELRVKFERASNDDRAPQPSCKDLGVLEVVVSES